MPRKVIERVNRRDVPKVLDEQEALGFAVEAMIPDLHPMRSTYDIFLKPIVPDKKADEEPVVEEKPKKSKKAKK